MAYRYTISKLTDNILSSVADPDTNPDPYVFGPSGSGSFHHQSKIVRKIFIPTPVLLCDFFFDFLSLKNDVNVPSKSNKQKNFFLISFFVGILKDND
jgi:hypothetical protein